METGTPSIRIYVDADACPVKDEVFRVAKRYPVPVLVVSNGPIRTPPDPLVESVVVTGHFDAADDWIAERITATDVAVAGRPHPGDPEGEPLRPLLPW